MILRIATHNSSTWYPVKTATNARGRSTRWSGRSCCTDKPAAADDRGEPDAPARAGRRGEKVKISFELGSSLKKYPPVTLNTGKTMAALVYKQ